MEDSISTKHAKSRLQKKLNALLDDKEFIDTLISEDSQELPEGITPIQRDLIVATVDSLVSRSSLFSIIKNRETEAIQVYNEWKSMEFVENLDQSLVPLNIDFPSILIHEVIEMLNSDGVAPSLRKEIEFLEKLFYSSQKEIEELYSIIRNLKKQNKSIIFISHKLDEILEICDEFTVLRDGEVVSTDLISKTSKSELISNMVGRQINQIFPKKKVEIGNEIFVAENLFKKTQFKDISFNLKHKEILGFYGLIGSGRTEIMKTIFGINKFDSGKLFFNDQHIHIKKPLDAISQGIVYLSEERQNLGLTGTMSVKDNLNLAMLEKNSNYMIVDELKNLTTAQKYKDKLNIKVSYWNQLAQNLSGGNQQKTVIGKWLATEPKIIILDEPTKGIDVGSKSAVHEFMGELVNEGMSIIMISAELPEIMGMCDRVAVVYKGLIKRILDVSKTSSEEILSYASGE